MDDDELTKLAVAQLISEGEKFAKRRELTYTLDEPTRNRPNLRYLKNTLKHCLSSNTRTEKITKSNASQKLQYFQRKRSRSNVKVLKNDQKGKISIDIGGPSHKQSVIEKADVASRKAKPSPSSEYVCSSDSEQNVNIKTAKDDNEDSFEDSIITVSDSDDDIL